MTDHIVAAVDIAAARPSTLALLHGRRVVEWFETRLVDEATAWLVDRRPEVIAIDAPCSVSHGLLAHSKDRVKLYAGRVCDLELMKRAIPLYQVPQQRSRVDGWMEVGYQLYDLLLERGYALPRAQGTPGSVIEIYPYSGFATLLGGRPAKKSTAEGIAQRVAVLEQQGLDWDGRSDHDSLDALVGALTGLRYLESRATAVGDPSEALLWLPVATLLRSYAHPVDYVESGGRRAVRRTSARVQSATGGQVRTRKRSPGVTTQLGYRNRNAQVVIRATDQPGTDHCQYIYVLRCGECTNEYGANGTDLWLRKCPRCQGGRPGLLYS